MNTKKENLGLITFGGLKDDEKHLLDIEYEMFPDDDIKIFQKADHIVFWENSYSPIDRKRTSSQQEFPLAALPWFIDTIEDKFWNYKPDPNALPGEVNEVTVINDEKIGINPMRHCCAENITGYSFWNASRQSYISRRAHHDWQIPRYMLEGGLMAQLKKISTNLSLKFYP